MAVKDSSGWCGTDIEAVEVGWVMIGYGYVGQLGLVSPVWYGLAVWEWFVQDGPYGKAVEASSGMVGRDWQLWLDGVE